MQVDLCLRYPRVAKTPFRVTRLTHVWRSFSIYSDIFPASIIYKSIAGRYRPVSYPDGPITARYRFINNASGVNSLPYKPRNLNKCNLLPIDVFKTGE